MSTKNAKKNREERLLARDFLQYARIDFEPFSICSMSEETGTSGPDVGVTCLLHVGRRQIGIEMTKYQNDVSTEGGGSTGTQVDRLFGKIRKSLWQSQSKKPEIRQVVGMVYFDREDLPRPNKCNEVAAELIRFTEDNLSALPPDERKHFIRSDRRGGNGDFLNYPLLERHFKKLTLSLLTGISQISWSYYNACSVCTDGATVVDLINKKATKLPSYDKSSTDETWLLICAGVAISTDSAGPQQHGRRRLADANIRCTASQSGFDRVIFWERVHGWHVDLA